MHDGKNKAPEGKYMGTVKVGTKGQIVIPKGARELFNIKPGDILLLFADISKGIAIVRNDLYVQFANDILRAQEDPERVNDDCDTNNKSD